LFCTTGVLLQKLIRSKNLRQYTHVILDEVHDRGEEMDFLFIVIRRLLAINAPKTKIILMSATIDASSFSNYYSLPCGPNNRLLPAPIVRIDRKRQFEVLEYYYDDLKKIWPNRNSEIDYSTPQISEDMYLVAQRLIGACDHFDMTDAETPAVKYTILIFLPGLYEIERLYKKLKLWFEME
jgi:ATP-dependent RNA helicase TDRD9